MLKNVDSKSMFPVLFEILIYFKVLFVIFVSLYIILSKNNEPSEFPDNYQKTYSFEKKLNPDK